LVGVVVAVVPGRVWRELLANVENAQFGPISIDLRRDAERAASQAAERDTAEGVDGQDRGEAEDMFELRMRLESKLAYVAKHLLASGGNATFLTIGSLEFDGYLTKEEARTAVGILSVRQEELEGLSAQARKEFLSEAGRFVASVRASVFWGQVKRRLKGSDRREDRSLLMHEISSTGRRHDLVAGQADRLYRVAPAFALDGDSRILANVITRLKKEGAAAVDERQLIVIPDISKEEEASAGDGRPRVVKLAGLREALLQA